MDATPLPLDTRLDLLIERLDADAALRLYLSAGAYVVAGVAGDDPETLTSAFDALPSPDRGPARIAGHGLDAHDRLVVAFVGGALGLAAIELVGFDGPTGAGILARYAQLGAAA